MRLALKHTDMFRATASRAAALGSRGGQPSAPDLAKENADKLRGKVRFLLIVGDKDPTFCTGSPVLTVLKELHIAAEYQELPGVDHNLGTYYSRAGPKLVRFVTADFTASGKPKAR